MKLKTLLLSLVLLILSSVTAFGQAAVTFSLANSTVGLTTQSTIDSGDANWLESTPITTGSSSGGYNLVSLTIWVGLPAAASWGTAVYTDLNGSPNTRLCSTIVGTTPAAGNNTLTPSGCGVLAPNTRYWLAQITASNPQEQGDVSGSLCPGQSLYSTDSTAALGSTTFPTTFGSSAQTGPSGSYPGICYTEYAVLAPISTSLVFGNKPVSVISVGVPVLLNNTGNATLTINSIQITGIFTSDFSQTNNCGGTLVAGTSCTITAKFTPQSLGYRTASLTVTDSASGSPHSIGLSGVGTHDVVVYWTASVTVGVTGYNVYRSTSFGGEGSTPINASLVTGTSYVDATVVGGVKYYYIVKATNGTTLSAASNETSVRVPIKPIIIVVTP